MSRRIVGGRPALAPRQLVGEAPGRIAPADELINTFEFEAMARRKLDSLSFVELAGSDRRAFDRITLRQRLMVNTMKLDLTLELFGQSMFAPILIGPTSRQNRFHPEGELAMARGAAAANTAMVVAANSSHTIDEIAAEAKTTLWYQVDPEPDMDAVRKRAQAAVKRGCKCVCLTLGATGHAVDWSAIARLMSGVDAPFLLKGIMRPDEARTAVQRGVRGIVVSNYRGRVGDGLAAPIEMLPTIAEAVAEKIPILIDGSFRRGSDVLKALALGARAVLLGRPPLWGLAAYGAVGVQKVLELMQNELARNMAMCGTVNLKAIGRGRVRIHRR